MNLYNILGSPEIDPSDAAQSCDHKTRNNDMVRISAHKFSPSKIKIYQDQEIIKIISWQN